MNIFEGNRKEFWNTLLRVQKEPTELEKFLYFNMNKLEYMMKRKDNNLFEGSNLKYLWFIIVIPLAIVFSPIVILLFYLLYRIKHDKLKIFKKYQYKLHYKFLIYNKYNRLSPTNYYLEYPTKYEPLETYFNLGKSQWVELYSNEKLNKQLPNKHKVRIEYIVNGVNYSITENHLNIYKYLDENNYKNAKNDFIFPYLFLLRNVELSSLEFTKYKPFIYDFIRKLYVGEDRVENDLYTLIVNDLYVLAHDIISSNEIDTNEYQTYLTKYIDENAIYLKHRIVNNIKNDYDLKLFIEDILDISENEFKSSDSYLKTLHRNLQ